MGNNYSEGMNSTDHSISSDEREIRRWSSFEYYPFKCGRSRLVYKGISFESKRIDEIEEPTDENLHDKGTQTKNKREKITDNIHNSYWSKRKCVVKTATNDDFMMNDKSNTESQWFRKMFITGNTNVSLFRKELNMDTEKKLGVAFAKSYLAQIDNMSSAWNPICYYFCRYKSRFSMDDIVLIEDRIEGLFRNFICVDGTSEYDCPPILKAFLHFTYHKSEGKLVICDFQGAEDESKILHLTVPTVHSIEMSFGPKDQGEEGIKEVFSNHKCNELCRKDWMKP
ncbi:alpha-protein kinase 1-like [Mytilus californianus]|uniref:alpha-protein kinase 1-like n=1 Tax=Mytilus californianus TaxID=6549 RepID=UPI002248333E|nr:alpha-protein kinase 1-like [Mytilus californianus]